MALFDYFVISQVFLYIFVVICIYYKYKTERLEFQLHSSLYAEKRILHLLKSTVQYSKSKASIDYSNISMIKDHIDNHEDFDISYHIDTLLKNATSECDRCCSLYDVISPMKEMASLYNIKIDDKEMDSLYK